METWIDSKTVFSGKIFAVRTGTVRLDDGSEAQRDVVEHGGGVAIVPVVNDEVILIRQFRAPINREIVELPAGRLEDGETPEDCAHRELAEEIGYRAEKLLLAHTYFSSVGFTNERMHIFLGLDLRETTRRPDPHERIETLRVPTTAIEAKLLCGAFEDAKTIIGLQALLAYLNGAKPG